MAKDTIEKLEAKISASVNRADLRPAESPNGGHPLRHHYGATFFGSAKKPMNAVGTSAASLTRKK